MIIFLFVESSDFRLAQGRKKNDVETFSRSSGSWKVEKVAAGEQDEAYESLALASREKRPHHHPPLRLEVRSSSPINKLRRALITLITIAPNKADQKLATRKLIPKAFDNVAVSESIAALITRMNSPSVRMINGQVSNLRIGRTSALSRPKIRATTPSWYHGPSKYNPGSSFTAAKIAIAVQIQRNKSFIPEWRS